MNSMNRLLFWVIGAWFIIFHMYHNNLVNGIFLFLLKVNAILLTYVPLTWSFISIMVSIHRKIIYYIFFYFLENQNTCLVYVNTKYYYIPSQLTHLNSINHLVTFSLVFYLSKFLSNREYLLLKFFWCGLILVIFLV